MKARGLNKWEIYIRSKCTK